MPYPSEIEEQMKRLYKSLNEKDRRRYAAISPMDEKVKWTNLTRQEISELLKEEGIDVSVTVVDQHPNWYKP
jgi:Trm5-related predicted tRNA methylase